MIKRHVFLYILVCSFNVHGDVGAFVENDDIDETQTIRLVIQTSNVTAEEPDWGDIENIFEIVGKSSNTRISTVNGRITSIAAWTLNLRAPGLGTFTIPSITVQNEFTAPIEVVVRPLPDGIKDEISNAVYFEIEIDREWVYVQSQLVVTQRILMSPIAQLINELPDLNLIVKANVSPIGEVEQFETTREGERYKVYEKRFAVFPEESGNLRIPSTDVLASVRLLKSRRRIPVRVPSEELSVEVRPKPATYPDGIPWFPARRVVLREDQKPPQKFLEPGDSITRVLTVESYGSPATAIPPIEYDVTNNLRIYEDPPELIDRTRNQQILGMRRQSHTLIASSSGPAQISVKKISWWNIEKDRLETATLPRQDFTIGNASTPQIEEVQIAEISTKPTDPVQPSFSVRPNDGPETWLVIIIAFGAIGWILALYFFRTRKMKQSNTPLSSNQKANAENLQLLKNKFRQTMSSQEDKTLLFSWVQKRFKLNRGEAISLILTHPAGKDLLNTINYAEYSANKTNESHSADPDRYIVILKELLSERTDKNSALPPLYPRQEA